MTVQTQPLRTMLYVCPECWLIGKIPQGRGSQAYRGACTGAPGADHKRRAMVLMPFRLEEETSGPGWPE